MTDYQLCLLDCSSIQKYVFGSNKLTTNIGASENVTAIFEHEIENTLIESFKLKPTMFDLIKWGEEDYKTKIGTAGSPLMVEAGYIGGGNALLIFRNGGNISAKSFVKAWSRYLLLKYPGIVPAAAIKDINITNGDINKNDIDAIFNELKQNKSEAVPQTIIPRHGITSACKMSGLSAEAKFTDSNTNETNWISSVTKAKTDSVDKADDNISKEIKKLLGEDYLFSRNLEKLGQTKAKNQIAVVHIDGNSMGKAFENCSGLIEKRKLSKAVNDATTKAWEDTVKALMSKMDDLIKHKVVELKEYKTKGKSNKLLPLRQIILNGDDVTFICNAQLAFWLAKTFMKKFAENEITIFSENGESKKKRLSSCAGIAIVKTKFPFYRAYMLAEELCASAKLKGREKGESWIDFEIVYGGISGSLEAIRSKKYTIGKASLLWRPWCVVGANNDFRQLEDAITEFRKKDSGKDKWPRSKLKELSQTLARGIGASCNLVTVFKARELELPEVAGLKDATWKIKDKKMRTPYFDILQALEFFPQLLVEDK